MDELISVIVPIYKVENYLKRCISSIINQTYKKLEIILVDDGSPDQCGKICDDYAKSDSRIRVIHKSNGGLSEARNVGLDIASGRYITFIDSDDFVSANYVETLYQDLTKTRSDISVVGMQRVFDGKKEKNEVFDKAYYPTICFSQKEALQKMLRIEIRLSAWGKLYKSELFNNIRFPVGKLYEDLEIAYIILLGIEKLAYSDIPLYKYMIREGSIMQTSFGMRNFDEIELIDSAMDTIEKVYPELHYEVNSRRIYSYLVTLRRLLYSENKKQYCKQSKWLRQETMKRSKGIWYKKDIKFSLKVKAASVYLGESAFFIVQRIIDIIMQKTLGYQYM